MDSVGASDTCDNFCPICRENITPPIATLDVCLHRYCYTCLKDWFDIHQSCPLDRKICRRITVLPPENTKKRIRCWKPGDRLQIRAFWNNLGEPDVSPINEARENDTQSENSDLAVSIATTEEDLIVFTIRLAGFVEKRIRTNLNGLSEDVVKSIVEELSEDLHVVPFLGLIFAGIEREPAEAADSPEEINRKRRDFLTQLTERCMWLGRHFIDIFEDVLPPPMYERLSQSLSPNF